MPPWAGRSFALAAPPRDPRFSSETGAIAPCTAHGWDTVGVIRGVLGSIHDSGGTDRRATELLDVQRARLGRDLRGVPRGRAQAPAGDAQRLSAPLRHGAEPRR